MKKYFLVFAGFFYFLLISCDGSFAEDTFAINLTYPEPDSKCEKGVPSGDGIIIPFQWELQGDINNFELILNNEPITVEPKILDGGVLEFEVKVDYSTSYSWQIKSPQTESTVREFRTPSSEPNDNSVPLAVTFNPIVITPQNNSTSIAVSWIGSDQENDGSLRYDAYWSTNEFISPENNDGEEKNLTDPLVTFSVPNFDANAYYYLLVVARDSENAAYSTLKYCQLCDD